MNYIAIRVAVRRIVNESYVAAFRQELGEGGDICRVSCYAISDDIQPLTVG